MAALIAAEAAAGQVLASQTTRLLAGERPNIDFAALGEHTLKGFKASVLLFDLCWRREGLGNGLLTRFIGRDDEVSHMRERLEAAVRGRGSVILLAGDAGVGKTRLVSELAIYAQDRGFEVLMGRAYEAEGMPPYLPLVEALNQYIKKRSPDELKADLTGGAVYLGQLLPRMREISGVDAVQTLGLTPEAERQQLFEGISAFVLNITERRPVMLALDDLHVADRATLLFVRHLSGCVEQTPLVIIGTYRDAEIDAAHPVSGLLTDLNRRRLDGRITVRPFGMDEAATLIEAISGKPAAPHVVDSVFSATEGNPFFIEELVRHLQDHGHDLAEAGGKVITWAIPEGSRELIMGRIARLRPDAVRLLTCSSLLGGEFSILKLAAVTRLDENTIVDSLDEGLSSHLLSEDADSYTFAHPLIREALYRGLSGPRRRQLHRQIGERLESFYAGVLDARELSELAHHFTQALPLGDVDRAIEYTARAGEAALKQLAYEEAVRLYELAVDALDASHRRDDIRRCDLLLSLGHAQIRASGIDRAKETFLAAAVVARKLNSPEKLARAALGAGARPEYNRVNEDVVGLLEDAVAALGDADTPLKASLLARLVIALQFSPAEQRKLALSQQAVEIARRVRDTAALAFALRARHFALQGPQYTNERLATAAEMLKLAENAGPGEAMEIHFLRLTDLLETSDIESVDAEIETCVQLAEELRSRPSSGEVLFVRAMRDLLRGRFEEAERWVQEALAIYQESQSANATQAYGMQMFLLRWEQGRLSELEVPVRAFVEQFPDAPAWRAALAFLYSELDRRPEALSEFERLAADDFSDLPRDALWTITVGLASEVCACIGDAQRAAVLHELLLPYARRNVVVMCALSAGAASRNLGQLSATMCRWEEAAAHFHEALRINAEMEAAPWLAHTQFDYAKMLLARRAAGDEERAISLLEQALQTCRRLGMTFLAEKASRLIAAGRQL